MSTRLHIRLKSWASTVKYCKTILTRWEIEHVREQGYGVVRRLVQWEATIPRSGYHG